MSLLDEARRAHEERRAEAEAAAQQQRDKYIKRCLDFAAARLPGREITDYETGKVTVDGSVTTWNSTVDAAYFTVDGLDFRVYYARRFGVENGVLEVRGWSASGWRRKWVRVHGLASIYEAVARPKRSWRPL